MERKQIIIVEYSQSGHYMYNEDTWNDSLVVETEKELLNACKEWHKTSASSFNNYPFCGLFSFNNLSFKKQNIIIDDSGEIFKGKKVDCEKPDYFEKVQLDFNTWIDNIRQRLPKLREARSKRLKEESERKEFEKLSLKYKT